MKTPSKKMPVIKFTFQAKTEMTDLGELQKDPNNHTFISKKDLDRLVESIHENPNMLMLRPIVYVIKNRVKLIKAGEKRYRACLILGIRKAPCINASKLTKKELEHFHLWDNERVGRWDFDALKDLKDLYGIRMPEDKTPHKYNNSNAEMPIIPKYDEKHRAVLIVVENELDFANLITVLNMGKAKDYKTKQVKQTSVISYKQFMKQWKGSK
jgi:hypothetical protein